MGRLILCLLCVVLARAGFGGELPAWQIDPAASRIEFVAVQAGAEFRGGFEHFDADIHFDPASLADSRVVVRIPTARVATFDEERDEILRGQGWFESDAFPEACFDAKQFEATAGGFRANGTLTMRDLTVPVSFDFRLTDVGLTGSAEVDRIALGLGLGDWADETWIGYRVRVEVVVTRGR